MKVEHMADGFQITVHPGEAALITLRASDLHPHGFGGSVLIRDGDTEQMQLIEFHGNGCQGVVCHDPIPFVE